MRNIAILICFIFFISCKKKDVVKEVTNPIPVFNDENWIQIKVPDAREIYAIAGNIDDTLVISTLNKTFLYTTDKGLTWQQSGEKIGRPIIPGLLVAKDTVYALIASGVNAKTNRKLAGTSSYYSLDKGITWKFSAYENSHKSMDIGTVTAKNGAVFELNYHYGTGNNQGYSLRTTISKTVNGAITPFTVPISEQPLNLYIDRNDRLYVTTSGKAFDNNGFFIGSSYGDPAYIYISKKAVSN